ncbi:unnamed protein product [Adineta steineri]|uniref:G-protein coupled receptors family 1 profile domain-containing protein n=1 Tax=Adineta steineri TaxID=433720 RepID=A0A818VVI0_9BILA|nr:unnamed protein product [Adineta steineri]CAF3716660.1 unnamed protein product [Adineta steineri]
MSNIIELVLRTNIYTQPIQFLLAIITNTFNIRILCSRTLHLSACTHYFLAYAILSIIYACLLCPIQFARGFSIDLIHGQISCKIHAYLLFVIPLQANIMIILASFDRYCSSSQICRLQSTSSIRIARKYIVSSILFCLIYMLPMLFIYNWDKNLRKCLLKSNTIINIYICSQVIIYYILSPILMISFGILTIYNIHQQSTRIKPLITSTQRRRTEGQLARMLVLQVIVHIILVLPFGILYSINSFIPSTQTPNIIAIRLIFVTWQQCDYFVSFFLYILSANIYREQFIIIVKSIKCVKEQTQYFLQSEKISSDHLHMVKMDRLFLNKKIIH